MTDTQEVVTQNEETSQETNTATDNGASNPKLVVIPATNPSTEEMISICENIQTNYDFDVVTKSTNFKFKRSLDKATGIITERDSVQLAIPYPSVQGVIQILEKGEKGLELLIESMETVVNSIARELLYEDTTLNAATFPVDKLAWEVIANMPKAQRRGGGIPKETWEGFAQNYCEVMPEVTGKSIEAIGNMARILQAKLSTVRTAEPVLQLVVEQLAIYISNSPQAEEFKECVEFLLNKAETYLNVSPEELLSAL